MKDWQQRLIEERGDLFDRMSRLNSFIHSYEFSTVRDAERQRIKKQYRAMTKYLTVLNERISVSDIY
jgi:hypothetical protein